MMHIRRTYNLTLQGKICQIFVTFSEYLNFIILTYSREFFCLREFWRFLDKGQFLEIHNLYFQCLGTMIIEN